MYICARKHILVWMSIAMVRLPTQSGWSWCGDRSRCVWGMLAHQPDPPQHYLIPKAAVEAVGRQSCSLLLEIKVLIFSVFLDTHAGWTHEKCPQVIYACGIFVQPWETLLTRVCFLVHQKQHQISEPLGSITHCYLEKCLLLVLSSSVEKLSGLPVEVFVKQSKR